MRRNLAITAAIALVFIACGGSDEPSGTATTEASATSDSTSTTADETSTTATDAPSGPVEIGPLETVVTGLEVPWAIAFVDADTFLVTERSGRVRVVEGGELRTEPVLAVDVFSEGEAGLLGIALHPEFPDERSAYLYMTRSSGNQVVRFDVGQDLTLSGGEVILEGIPFAPFHDGGRIAFGPDGMLYVTTGDAGQPELAADPGSLAGKILRIAPDGSVPSDNPFDGSPVWSYGHRNPQGLAWDDDGQLFASEHGPSGDFGLCCNDEVNSIEPGGFYGWPYLAATTEASAGEPPEDPIPPIATSGSDDTWAPAGTTVVGEGENRTLLLATLAGNSLLRFDLGAEVGAPVEAEVVTDDFGRLRVATTGPEGCLWVATSNRDGRGEPVAEDDRILQSC